MPHPGTAAPAPLVTAAVFPAAAGHFGPTPGTADQDTLLTKLKLRIFSVYLLAGTTNRWSGENQSK